MKDGKLVFETDQMGAFAVYQPTAVDTEDPGANDGDTETPVTGDSSPIVLWFAVSLLSLATLTVLGGKKKTVK